MKSSCSKNKPLVEALMIKQLRISLTEYFQERGSSSWQRNQLSLRINPKQINVQNQNVSTLKQRSLQTWPIKLYPWMMKRWQLLVNNKNNSAGESINSVAELLHTDQAVALLILQVKIDKMSKLSLRLLEGCMNKLQYKIELKFNNQQILSKLLTCWEEVIEPKAYHPQEL